MRESSFNAFATPLMLSASLRNASETTLYALARSHNSAQLSVTPLLVNYHPWEASSVQGRLHATPLICWFAGFTAPPSHRAHYPAGYINWGVQVSVVFHSAFRAFEYSSFNSGNIPTSVTCLRGVLSFFPGLIHHINPFQEGFIFNECLEFSER